jgi:hypothetical protein
MAPAGQLQDTFSTIAGQLRIHASISTAGCQRFVQLQMD